MSARRLVFACVVAALGCGGATPRANEIPPAALTDDNACTRLCDRLRSCGGAPSKCDASCERDRSWLRVGFTASFVGCVEREVGVNVCTPPDDEKRAGAVSLCYSATLNVFAARDKGESARAVVLASCRRGARCNPDAKIDESACVAELEKKLHAAVMILAVAKKELVAGVASCIEASACEDHGTVPRCLESIHPSAPQETKP